MVARATKMTEIEGNGKDMSDSGVESEGMLARGLLLAHAGNTREALRFFVRAAERGSSDAAYNAGVAQEGLGELDLAPVSYDQAWKMGCAAGGIELAFMNRESGKGDEARRIIAEVAAQGDEYARAVHACWEWESTNDPALEKDLRTGARLYSSARVALSDLLIQGGKCDEAEQTLKEGVQMQEMQSFLPLGNMYADLLGNVAAAADAYRAGAEIGDVYCHNNLGVLLRDEGDIDGAKREFEIGAALGEAKAQSHLSDL